MNGTVEIAGLVDGVGIREEKPATAGSAGCGPNGVVLACPAFFELGGFEDGDAAKAPGNLRRAIGGLVVDNDEFPIEPQLKDVFRLGDEGFEARGKIQLFVAGGDNDGEFDELFRFGLIKTVPVRVGMASGSPGSSDSPRTGLNGRPPCSAISDLSAIVSEPFIQ